MKRLIAILITLAMLIGAAPLAVFAGGDGFPDEPCINEGDPIRGEGSFSGTVPAYSTVYVDFYSGSAGIYVFESISDYDLSCTLYDADGYRLGYNDDIAEYNRNFRLYSHVDWRVDVYLAISNYSDTDAPFTVTAAPSDIASVEVVNYPWMTTYLPHDDYARLDGLEFLITYTDGTSARWFPAVDPLSPDGATVEQLIRRPYGGVGKSQVRLSCYGYFFFYDVTFIAYKYNGAYVMRMPYKTEYIIGTEYEFDPDGMLIQLTKNGSGVETLNFHSGSEGIPALVQSIYYEPLHIGENIITVTMYNGVQTALTVMGVESPVASIELLREPDKKTYTVYNAAFSDVDLTGAKLRIHYTAGGYDDVDITEINYQTIGQYSVNAYFKEWEVAEGDNVIVIDYCGASCEYHVTGVPSGIESIEFNILPDKLDYYLGDDNISLKGASLYINYTNGSSKEVKFNGDYGEVDGYTIQGYLNYSVRPGQNLVTVYFYGVTATYYINYMTSGIKRVTLAREPDKTHFPQTACILQEDLAGLKVNILYDDGSSEVWDYTANGGLYGGSPVFDAGYVEEEGPNAVTLSFNGKEFVFYIIGDGFFVMQSDIVKNPDRNGSNASVRFKLEDGYEFIANFPGIYSGDIATGILSIPGRGNFFYILQRNVKQADVTGVMIYVFGREIFAPCDNSAVMKGDLDNDGEISVGDALIALRIAARLMVADMEDILIGDVDGDSTISVGDALKILRVAAKLEPQSTLYV